MGRTPLLNSKGISTVRLPEMSGGINNTDAPNSIKDNQLQDESDMVFSGGAYKTRQSFKGTENIIKNGKISTRCIKAGFVNYDKVQSVTNEVEIKAIISGECKYINGQYLATDSSLVIEGMLFVRNMFSKEKYGEYLYGNLNSYLIKNNGEFVPVYMDDRREPLEAQYHTGNNFYCGELHPETASEIVYVASPVLEKGLGVFLYVCGRRAGTDGSGNQYPYKLNVYELHHIKDTEYSADAADFESDGYHFAWVKISKDKFYTPTVYVNGKGNTYPELPSDLQSIAPASTFESENALTRRFNAYFTTDAGNYAETGGNFVYKGSHSFTLPFVVGFYNLEGINVLSDNLNITYTNNKGQEILFSIPNGSNYIECGVSEIPDFNLGYDGYWVRVEVVFSERTTTIVFTVNLDAAGKKGPLQLPRGVANNIKVTGYLAYNSLNEKLARYTKCTWFGGTNAGLTGGTRLFMYGSDLEPNKIVWSDVDNPLYFPKSNYMCVGEQSDPVTVLAKQSNMLVIAKQFSLHYTSYVDNSSSYTAEQVVSGSVNDVAAISAIFPITQISDSVGCDLPRTMQLCANDLVWTNSDGRIYTLKSASQYSECNVYELSYPVQNIVQKAITDNLLYEVGGIQGYFTPELVLIKTIFAADYNGGYYLFTPKKIFVMQYSDSGFKYSYSYAEGNRVKNGISFDVIDISNITTDGECFFDYYEYQDYTRFKKVNICYRLNFARATDKGLFVIREGIAWDLQTRCTVSRMVQMLSICDSEFDCNIACVNKVGLNTYENKNGDFITEPYDIRLSEPKQYLLTAHFTTKQFDLGGSYERKRIEHIYYSFEGSLGTQINVYAITDKGEKCIGRQTIDTPNIEKEQHIRCCLHGVKYLSLRVEISGRAEIRGFAVKYKNLGGY